MAKTNLAVKTDTTNPVVQKEYLAHFSHIKNSLITYRIAEKGRSQPIGTIVLKIQDLPMGFTLGLVHPVDELQALTE